MSSRILASVPAVQVVLVSRREWCSKTATQPEAIRARPADQTERALGKRGEMVAETARAMTPCRALRRGRKCRRTS